MSMMLGANNLRCGYKGKAILPSVSFELKAGELCALVGRNGSGKTTLLRTLLGLLEPVSGEVLRPRGGIGYVAQRAELLETVPARVVDLVAGGWERGWSFLGSTKGRREAVEGVMNATGCSHLAGSSFNELSEGQKQRVLLARAMASNPEVLVLDEPASAMDSEAEAHLFDVLDELRKDRGVSILVVSHGLERLLERAERALFVDRREQVFRALSVEELMRDSAFRRRYPALAMQQERP